MNDKTPTVVFLNPPGPEKLYRSMVCTFISKANYLWQPQDFINLSAQIPSSYALRFLDCSINGISREQFFADAELCEEPAFCVTAVTSLLRKEDLEFVKLLRGRWANTRLILFGDLFLEPIFRDEALVYCDGIILNSLDSGLADYISAGISHSPNFITPDTKTEAGSVSGKDAPRQVSIGIPRHNLFVDKKYRFPFARSLSYSTVTTQFGCPFRCHYCSQSKISVTYRPAVEVVQEIEHVRALGVRDLFFGDPSFGFPRDNAKHILQEMLCRNLGMRWCCYANPMLLDTEFLGLMKEAGCHTMIIGIDDNDFAMLAARFKRALTRERLDAFCADAHKLGMRICADFIIGLHSDSGMIDDMVELAKELYLDYASFNIFSPLLGSITRDDMVKNGEIDPRAVGCDTSGTLGEANKRLVLLRNKAIMKFYFRPSYIARRLSMIRSASELGIQCSEMTALLWNCAKSALCNSNFLTHGGRDAR